MFVAYELHKDGVPVAMGCDVYASVWSHHYQTVFSVDGMQISKVSAYHNTEYQYRPICGMKKHCKGNEFYLGGDCSGWGAGLCQEDPQPELSEDEPQDDVQKNPQEQPQDQSKQGGEPYQNNIGEDQPQEESL